MNWARQTTTSTSQRLLTARGAGVGAMAVKAGSPPGSQ